MKTNVPTRMKYPREHYYQRGDKRIPPFKPIGEVVTVFSLQNGYGCDRCEVFYPPIVNFARK